MKKHGVLYAFISLIILSSCQIVNGDSSSSVISEDNSVLSIEEITSENSSSSEEIISDYEEDELGFYKLNESDYYHKLSVDGESVISYEDIPEGIPTSNSLKLFEEGNEIPLYNVKTNTSQTWNAEAPNRIDNSVAIIQKSGPITLVLQTNFTLKHGVTIRPLNEDIEFSVDENKRLITFTIVESGQYTIEFRLNRTLHLFVDDLNMYEEEKNKPGVIYLGPGIHNKNNNSRIDSNNNFRIYSNQTVFLDYGAVLEGSFVSDSCSNIKIVGGGVIDGQKFARSATTGSRQIPLDFNYCNNVEIHGITTLDPAGWTYNMYFNNTLKIDNIKIISSRSNGDGISLQSCQNVNVSNCFVRSWDDSLVVKNYPHWSNKNNHGTTRNIYFSNCILWTDLAQSMEIGFETIGKVMDNINFEDIIVLHNFHKPVISIHNGNNADVTNVKFKNILVEDASLGKGDGTINVIEFTTAFSSTWSTNHTTTELGSIKGVTLENIDIISTRNDLKINILGCVDTRKGYNNSVHKISDITFIDLTINDELIDENYKYLYTNEYVENLKFL